MWSWPAFFDFLISPSLLEGAWLTVWLTLVTMLLGLTLGFVLAVFKMSRVRVLRVLSEGYIWLFRGTPLLVQLVILYTGLPQVGIRLPAITAAIIGLALNEAAYLAETIRSGIMSVHRGQSEAAQSLGMGGYHRYRLVILPQAIRIIVPPLSSSLNGLLKLTTLVSIIAVNDLLRMTTYAVQENFRVLEGLAVAALYYLAMTTFLTFVQQRLEKRLNRGYKVAATGPKKQRIATGERSEAAMLGGS
jgi:polar amino acid transport system permease protein